MDGVSWREMVAFWSQNTEVDNDKLDNLCAHIYICMLWLVEHVGRAYKKLAITYSKLTINFVAEPSVVVA